MISSSVLGVLIGMFRPDSDSASSSLSELSGLSDLSSSEASKSHAKMYTKEGYDILYSIAIGSQVIAFIILLCINTGRGRKAQQLYKEEMDQKNTVEDSLIPAAAQNESDAVVNPEGSINSWTNKSAVHISSYNNNNIT